jgi:hypothetical protein
MVKCPQCHGGVVHNELYLWWRNTMLANVAVPCVYKQLLEHGRGDTSDSDCRSLRKLWTTTMHAQGQVCEWGHCRWRPAVTSYLCSHVVGVTVWQTRLGVQTLKQGRGFDCIQHLYYWWQNVFHKKNCNSCKILSEDRDLVSGGTLWHSSSPLAVFWWFSTFEKQSRLIVEFDFPDW